MAISINQLKPASLKRSPVLLKKTTQEALHTANKLFNQKKIVLNADETQFVFILHSYLTLKQHKAFLTRVTRNGQTMACAQFELTPFSDQILTEVAEMNRLDSNAPEFGDTVPELEYSNLALHVATSYIYRFCGIGTTLLAFNLLIAAHLGAPLMRAIDDVSAISSITEKSFLDKHGFRPGQDLINLSSTLGKTSLDKIHREDEKIFFLNNIFDGTIDFIIPEIGIKSRAK